MFTITDIKNIAVQIELNGEKSYRKASLVVEDPTISATFERMADDEKNHADWFSKITSTKELTEEQREMEAVGKNLLQEMVKDRTFSMDSASLKKVENMEELLNESRGFEEDTILFYEMLSGFIEDQSTLDQLNEIIDEEKRHIQELESMFQQVIA